MGCYLHQLLVLTILTVVQVYTTIFDTGGGPGLIIQPPTLPLMHSQQLHSQTLAHQAQLHANHFSKHIIPPLVGSKYLTLPQLPVGVKVLPNASFHGHHFAQFHHKGGPPIPPGMINKHKSLGFIPIPPGSPAQLLKSQKWVKKEAASNAELHELKPAFLPQPVADPFHHLPIKPLFVPVPKNAGPGSTPPGRYDDNCLEFDILENGFLSNTIHVCS